MSGWRGVAGLAAAVLLVASEVVAADCPPPTVELEEDNLFSPERERELGDLLAEHIEGAYALIDDPGLDGWLQALGDELASHVPELPLSPSFHLIDLPIPNAFTAPGGRVYVTRKLVAFVENEAELAAVVAHELGHVVSRHSTAELSRMLRMLGVESVATRAAVVDAYHRISEASAEELERFEPTDHDDEQSGADRVALYTMAAVGWEPEVAVGVFDRLFETEGKAGNWFSDFLGRTRPHGKRLRRLLNEDRRLHCVAPEVTFHPEQSFEAWRDEVIGWSRTQAADMGGARLEPPLRLAISNLRFSPDGRWLLAQDDASVFVLRREGTATAPRLSVAFRIDAAGAYDATFSPDSTAIHFHTHGLRVERWNLAAAERLSANEVVVLHPCLHSVLAPDARTLACWSVEAALQLIDVASGEILAEKERFLPLNSPVFAAMFGTRLLGALFEPRRIRNLVTMEFTPDSRHFAAGCYSETFAWDLERRRKLDMSRQVKSRLGRGFTFLDPDRILGSHDNPDKSGIISWPKGRDVEPVPMAGQALEPSACGGYLLVRPAGEYAVAAMRLSDKRFFVANKTRAFDLWHENSVSERASGEIALYEAGEPGAPAATLTLPLSRVGQLREARFSPDLRWLVLSGWSRGGVWRVADRRRVYHSIGFTHSSVDEAGHLVIDLPADDERERRLTRLDLSDPGGATSADVGERRLWLDGPWLVQVNGEAERLEVRDAHDEALLWTRSLPHETPIIHIEPPFEAIVLEWSIESDYVARRFKKDRTFKRRKRELGRTTSFVEVVDAASGEVEGTVFVDSGSILIQNAVVADDRLIVGVVDNRVLVYQLGDDEPRGRLFGRAPIAAAGLLGVIDGRGRLVLHDLATLAQRRVIDLPGPIALAGFNPAGDRLAILTADQVLHEFTPVVEVAAAP